MNLQVDKEFNFMKKERGPGTGVFLRVLQND